MKFIKFNYSHNIYVANDAGIVQGAIKCINSFFDRCDKGQQRHMISHLATGEDFSFEQIDFCILPAEDEFQSYSWICFTAKINDNTQFEVINDLEQITNSIAYQYAIPKALIQHAFESIDNEYLDERVIQSRTSPKQLHFAKQGIVDTVRLTFAGLEIGYWTLDEWKEDPSLLGTILYSMA